ncbi:MAG TPA: ABC transporter permease [Fibrobacteraceae bacterium]|nr:ABC transporter permease [Fibrobacteraceae bacterium]
MHRIFLHELRLVLREPRFWIPFLVPPMFLVAMQSVALWQYGAKGQVVDPNLLLVVGALLSTMSVTLTSDSFAGERERNTLELLLSLPIGLPSLFWGKLLALLPLPLALSSLSLILLWKISGLDGIYLIKTLFYSISVCLVVTGISLLISLFAKTVRSAAQTNVLFVLVVLVATQLAAPWYFSCGWASLVLFPCALLAFATLSWLGLRRFGRMN